MGFSIHTLKSPFVSVKNHAVKTCVCVYNVNNFSTLVVLGDSVSIQSNS